MDLRRLGRGLALVVIFTCRGPSADAQPRDYLRRPDSWFATAEARQIARHIVAHQSTLGGWPKNIDTTAALVGEGQAELSPTYDNRATTDELRYLARMCRVHSDSQWRAAFDRGIDYVFAGQYDSGGWPQRHPPGDSYHRHITLNDHVMVRLLEFVRDVASSEDFSFVDAERRARASAAFDRGVSCLLRCQIRLDGELTGWCAQHDPITYQPQPGRAFELATLSGCETVGVVRLLMSLEQPPPEIQAAVQGAVRWLEQVQLRGIKIEERPLEGSTDRFDRIVVSDPLAPPIWARFYDLRSQTPVFADRAGVPCSRLQDISYERRNGYAWYGDWPRDLIERDYPAWRARLAQQHAAPE